MLRIAGESEKALPKRIAFTVDALNRVKCPPDRDRVYVYDSRRPGLCLMVTDSGKMSFYVYRKVHGRPERIRLGGYPDISIEQARKMAENTGSAIANGIDPMAEKRSIRKDATLQEVWNDYLAVRATEFRASTLVTDKSRFATCFDSWKSRKIRSIRREDVGRLLRDVGKDRGHVTANRAGQLLRRLMNHAKVIPNPCYSSKRDPLFFHEQQRDRHLAGDELARLMATLDTEPNQTIADFIRLALWTGQRRGNVASMKWSEVNLELRTWSIPSEKFKTGKAITVPLVDAAIDVLKHRPRGEYVFPSDSKAGHLIEPKAAWKRILTNAGIGNCHIHDLRHTLATWAVQHGEGLQAVGKLLGHARIATTERYGHIAVEQARGAAVTASDAMIAAIEASKKAAKKSAKKSPKAKTVKQDQKVTP